MKFGEISKEQWAALQPYLDTCLLPITGLSGKEQPWEAGDRLEELRDAMDLIEIPYGGRIVTYPAVQYMPGQAYAQQLEEICAGLKQAGFKHIVAITTSSAISAILPACADLQLFVDPGSLAAAPDEMRRTIGSQIQTMWNRNMS